MTTQEKKEEIRKVVEGPVKSHIPACCSYMPFAKPADYKTCGNADINKSRYIPGEEDQEEQAEEKTM